MKPGYRAVGTVREIWRYPVKSMAGEPVEAAKIGWNGLGGDRRYAFNRVGNRSGLPFLSAREMPELILYRPAFLNAADPDHSGIDVTTPAGPSLDLYAAELRAELEALHGGPLEVISLWRGAYDAMPVSLITTNSMAMTGEALGKTLQSSRFRPNLVIEAMEAKAFPEDRWIGELLVFGEDDDAARLRVNRKDLRCTVVNLNPLTAAADADVLAHVVRTRKNFLGAYGTTERPGKAKAGDIVYIDERR